jgi:predicted amidohydrolase YtcJ
VSPAAGGSVTFVDVELEGRPGQQVDVVDGVVAYAGPRRGERRAGAVVDGCGGALLPGLHDHHLHLAAAAAEDRSVACGPPAVAGPHALGRALRDAAAAVPPGTWVRGVGFDDTRSGPLDAPALDHLLGSLADRPVRIRHRSGHRWILNGAATAAVRAAAEAGQFDPAALGPGTDLDRGIVHGGDRTLRAAWPGDAPPSLGTVGSPLARAGCTGVTDASADAGAEDLALVARAQDRGELPQRVQMLGRDLPEPPAGGRVRRGPAKLVLEEAGLPALDDLVDEVVSAGRRGVAVHCVGRASLVLAAAALGRAGGGPHRLEHASVATPGAVRLVASVPATVVTQPGFVAAHGDRYLGTVEPGDQPWLYRLAGWPAAGVPLAGGSDAPYGPLDPWAAMRAAVTRRTRAGAVLGPGERLTPERALALYLAPLPAPGGPPRRVVAGAPADLCLLSAGWSAARHELDAALVRATYCSGVAVFGG